jgi:hypothetical protein
MADDPKPKPPEVDVPPVIVQDPHGGIGGTITFCTCHPGGRRT